MKILSMTATFGKLEHETLTLESGLNIIQAPNEWGKSTWCAFLVAMLYGIETRSHSTKAALAEKERYAPWSGSPMSGKLELLWHEREITIERKTKGRIPLGDFKAYETASGLPVPELTASNCGQLLLGVEKSVFLRSGFIKLADMPVTQDESLRRRLNALVTTADDSGTADLLAQKLKDLKNRCRFNRTGLLPQAEARQAELENKLAQLHALQDQALQLKQRQAELDSHVQALDNHRQALEYQQSLTQNRKLSAAKAARDALETDLAAQEALCQTLPTREEADRKLSQLRQLRDLADSTHMESQMLPTAPQPPRCEPVFYGLSPEDAVSQAIKDRASLETLELSHKKTPVLSLIAMLLLLLAGVGLMLFSYWIPGILGLAGAAILLTVYLFTLRKTSEHNRRIAEAREKLMAKYHPIPPERWCGAAQDYAEALHTYHRANREHLQCLGDLDARKQSLKLQLQALTEGETPSFFLQKWTDIMTQQDKLADLRRAHLHAQEHYAALRSAVKELSPPAFPDCLTYSDTETRALLSDAEHQQRQLQLRLGQATGQMETLGDENQLLSALSQIRLRISQLEKTYAALILAQETLVAAAGELQRRFAPRIAQRTRELFSRLTGSRYNRLILGEDMDLHVGAQGEDTLRGSLWHSDGTVDQLYLALRLAVAEALIPEAPLVLDDALVRFDDKRLSAALEVLQEESAQKQILLFTCQDREKRLLEGAHP